MQILRLTIPELHPGDEDVWPGTPGLQPSDEDLSPGTAGMKGVWGPVRFPRTKAEEQPQIARLRSG